MTKSIPLFRAAALCSAFIIATLQVSPAAAANPVLQTPIPGPYAELDTSRVTLGSVKAAVFDPASGSMVYSKNADVPAPIASITKVMTAMVVLDSGQPLDEMLTIRKAVRDSRNNGYSRMRIGSKLSRGDLMRIMLMASENLAAYNLADHYDGGFDAFVDAMNNKAKALGMGSSHFQDASGLSVKNVSTASDLVKMLTAADEYQLIREYSTTPGYTARFENPRYNLRYGNTNRLVHRSSWDIDLSKTGYLNEAGRCLVMMTRIDGREVAMVLLDSFGKLTPIGDAGRIRRWLTTGSSGAVAGAALTYERTKSASYR
ncbi:D-alanyl-D-alanine endopeptidase [Gilvimarinus sp. F26214L]|uniref:D-alanyl-D-alanine endopeptidase n=1 Tax=Gilvimarinus sp. DZF01 TaxID=3461371 RepID=UPI00404561F0